jgi:hypothetical protein
MYDPKFEKGVRQKMEGLEFAPPDTVWANIEKAVAGRRRRPGFYLWRFALPGLLLVGAVSVVFLTGTPVHIDATASQTTIPNTKAVTSDAAPVIPAAPATSAAPANTSAANTSPANASADPANATAAAANATATPANAPATPANATAATANRATAPATSADAERATSTERATASAASATPDNPSARALTSRSGNTSVPATPRTLATTRTTHGNAQPQLDDAAVRQRYHNAGSKSIDEANKTNSYNTKNTTASDETSTLDANNSSNRIAPYLYQPTLVGQGSSAAIKAAKASGKKTLISLNTLQKKKRPWEAGFMAGGGISRLNRLNVSSGNQTLSASLYNITTASYSYSAAPSKSYVADIKPDASFEAGIYLQKPLSDRWTLNLGMNLHYYSTRITIGEPVNTYVPLQASLVSPTVTANAQSATAFIAGDRENFTNHYYFLELPVNIQYTLKKSRMLPIFLQGGFSLSRLVGADALFYNTHSGVYYKDPNVLQKTQINVASALMVGLPFHGIRMELGPQIQYGLTPLINNHNQGDQHFLYTGLRLVVIPGKN